MRGKLSFITGITTVFAASFFIGCGKTKSDVQDPSDSLRPPGSTTFYTDTITIQNFAFGPAELLIAEGGTVLWVNKDKVIHTVTSDNKIFDSGDIPEGGSFVYTFSVRGVYTYRCKYHNEMYGSVRTMIK